MRRRSPFGESHRVQFQIRIEGDLIAERPAATLSETSGCGNANPMFHNLKS
jgi:hypothetical protein